MNLKQYKQRNRVLGALIIDDKSLLRLVSNKRTTLKGIARKRAIQSLKDKWKSMERFHYPNYIKPCSQD